MKILKNIGRDGRIDVAKLAELAREHPECAVFLTWGNGSHTGHTAANAAAIVSDGAEPVREIRVCVETLCDALGEWYLPELSLEGAGGSEG